MSISRWSLSALLALTAAAPAVAARSAYTTTEAESFDAMQGVVVAAPGVGYLDSGDYLVYRGMDFGVGASSCDVRVAVDAGYAGKQMELRLDGVAGLKIGSLKVSSTGGWSTFQTQTTPVTGASGIHDLYVMMAQGTGSQPDGIGNLDWIRFSSSTVAIPPTPATRSAYSPIQAETYDTMQGVVLSSPGVGYLDSGDFLQFKGVDFGTGVSSATLNVAVAASYAGKQMELRLDSATGTKVGALTVQSTGGWNFFQPQTVSVTGASSVHNLFVVMAQGSGAQPDGIGNLDWLTFSSATVVTPPVTWRDAFSPIQAESYDGMQGVALSPPGVGYLDSGDFLWYKNMNFGAGANSVSVTVAVDASYAGKQIEFRLDSVSGTKVGALTVQSTGGWATYQPQTAAVSGASGTHDLYLVMVQGTGRTPDGIGNLDAFQFSTATLSSPPTTTLPAPSTGTLRLAQWNVSHGDAGIAAQVQQIKASHPDVVVLSEVPAYYAGQADQYRTQLQQATGVPWYPVLAVHNTSGFGDANMILSRIAPTASGAHSLGRNSWADMRNAAWATIPINGVPVTFFGIHMDWPNETYLLENMAELLTFAGTFSGPKLITGDFNASYDGGLAAQRQVIADIRTRYSDSFVEYFGSDQTCMYTLNNGWRPDSVYHNTGLATVSISVNQQSSLSDHYMTTAVLNLTGVPNPSISVPPQTTVSSPSSLSGIRIYPNPWRADRHAAVAPHVTFDQLGPNTSVKLFTLAGHGITTLPTSSGTVTWNLTTDAGQPVASGLYLYLMTTDAGEKRTGTLAVIR